MNCRLKCDDCGAEAWHTGEDEPDVNAFIVDDSQPIKWEGGKKGCVHDNYTVVETETPDLYQDWNS